MFSFQALRVKRPKNAILGDESSKGTSATEVEKNESSLIEIGSVIFSRIAPGTPFLTVGGGGDPPHTPWLVTADDPPPKCDLGSALKYIIGNDKVSSRELCF